jgi:predicted transcriptional regulator
MKRDKLDLILDILTATKEEPKKKTHILYIAHINFYQLQRYCDFLTKVGLLEEVNGLSTTSYYKTTDKGKTILEIFGYLNGIDHEKKRKELELH